MRKMQATFLMAIVVAGALFLAPHSTDGTEAASSQCADRQAALQNIASAYGDSVWYHNFGSLCKRSCPELSNLYIVMPSIYNDYAYLVEAEWVHCLLNQSPNGGGCKKYSNITSAPIPLIVGKTTVGSTLSAKPGIWKPTGVKFKFTWYKGSSKISGANGSSLEITQNLVGAPIKVGVTGYKNCYKSATKYSKPTNPIKAKPAKVYSASDFVISIEDFNALSGAAFIREASTGISPLMQNVTWSVTGTSTVKWSSADVYIYLPVEWYVDSRNTQRGSQGCLHNQTWNITATFSPQENSDAPPSPPVTISRTYTCSVPSYLVPKFPDFNKIVDPNGLTRLYLW